MSGKRFYVLAGTFALVAVVALALVYGGFLENSNDVAGIEGPAPAIDSITNPALETDSAGASMSVGVSNASGPSEGVQIHGHWTIEMRNPDGTLASRREFDNVLISGGQNVLAQLLKREKSMGLWHIALSNTTIADDLPCFEADENPSFCLITEPDDPTTLPGKVFNNLTLPPHDGTVSFFPLTLILQGTAIAQRDGGIELVIAQVNLCPVNSTACHGHGDLYNFSSSTVSPVQAVVTGQQILVTIEFSFS